MESQHDLNWILTIFENKRLKDLNKQGTCYFIFETSDLKYTLVEVKPRTFC